MSGLRFISPSLEDMCRELLEDRTAESCAVAFARWNRDAHSWVVADWQMVPEAAYERRDSVSAVLRPAYLAELANRSRAEGLSLVLAHTHPDATGVPRFSAVDDAGEDEVSAFLERRAAVGGHLSLVVGPQGCRCRRIGSREEVPVWEIGQNVVAGSVLGDNGPPLAEHDRQVRAFGAAGQSILAGLEVVIVGAGGTGSIVLQQLAHLGVRRFTVVDPDVVETTNLNRLIGSRPGDVGMPKVEVARRTVLAINPDATVEAIWGDIVDASTAGILPRFDFAFLCTDSHASRAVVNQAAYQHLVPTIDMGVSITVGPTGVEHVTGRVQMLTPGTTCLTCTQALNAERVRQEMMTPEQRAADPYVQGIHEPQPAVVSLNSTMASLAVTMFLGAVTPVPSGARFQLYDGIKGAVRPTVARADPHCVVCSADGALAQGISWPLPTRKDRT
jgi:molybdopterin/thiamine biosynthesis adenylyltransferase